MSVECERLQVEYDHLRVELQPQIDSLNREIAPLREQLKRATDDDVKSDLRDQIAAREEQRDPMVRQIQAKAKELADCRAQEEP